MDQGRHLAPNNPRSAFPTACPPVQLAPRVRNRSIGGALDTNICAQPDTQATFALDNAARMTLHRNIVKQKASYQR